MREPQLKSALLVQVLRQRAESAGGFGTVLARGESDSGAVLVVLTEKGGNPRAFERALSPDGHYRWQTSYQAAENEEQFTKFLERRRKVDPDMWLIELDVPCAERFTAEINESV